MAKAPQEKFEPSVLIRNDQLQTTGYRIKQLECIVPAALNPNKILDPNTWAHVTHKLTPYCEITALWDDGSKLIKIMCTHVNGAASRFVALTELIELESLTTANVRTKEDMLVEERGPLKWCVIDAATGDVLKDMLETQASAMVWRDEARRARVVNK